MQKCGFDIRYEIVWLKPHFPITRGVYAYQHDSCWYGVRNGKTAKWAGESSQSTVWRIALDEKVDGGHAAQRPVECMAKPIRNHGTTTDDVYDPFLGSGTTMVAAEQLDRTCVGIEVEPKYVAVCLERMALLGLEPKLVK
jgi:DNA modification methylase